MARYYVAMAVLTVVLTAGGTWIAFSDDPIVSFVGGYIAGIGIAVPGCVAIGWFFGKKISDLYR